MTEQDNILRLAREAGMNLTPAQFSGVLEDEIDEYKLAKFAALVKAEAVAETREACANRAAAHQMPFGHCQTSAHAADMTASSISAAIRAMAALPSQESQS